MESFGKHLKLHFPNGIWVICIVAISLSACKKTDPMINPNAGPVNVYLAGWRSYPPNNEVATYWKNDVLTDLTDGSKYITATSVATSGTDVYIGGNQFINNHSVALYWKNGVMAALTDTSKDSFVGAETISGSDIYFAGYENDGGHKIAKYWKNGQGVNLTSGLNDAKVLVIAVSSNDVYAAGWESNGTIEVAKYWKNGTAVSLSDGTQNTEAGSIAVSGNDIYVLLTEYILLDPCPECGRAGAATSVSTIWKNDSIIITAAQNQFFSSITLANNVLYIAGNDKSAASYFKNGVAYHLTDGSAEAQASGIGIWGSDVYVSGYENISGHNVPTYWKNGKPVRLTDGTNNAYSPVIYLSKW